MTALDSLFIDRNTVCIFQTRSTTEEKTTLEVYQNGVAPTFIQLLVQDESNRQRYLQLRVEEL